jgi:glutamate dehydrogenase/leucine dehydrogenase
MAACFNPAGIDIHQLLEYKYRNGTTLGFRGAEAMPSEELLVSECEILIPAATENVITSRNADQIKARIVVEGANGPTTAVADEILAEKRIFIVPDILANAGGVTASYFEWVQDRQGYFWKEAIVNEQLETILRDSLRRGDDVVRYRVAEAHNVNNRIAAYMLAIDRVASPSSSAAVDLRIAGGLHHRGQRSGQAENLPADFYRCLCDSGPSVVPVAIWRADCSRQVDCRGRHLLHPAGFYHLSHRLFCGILEED